MDAFFTKLGHTVLERWKQENFSLAKFPEIARAAVEARPPADHVDLAAFIREFLLNDTQPFQTQSGFAQPEIVVYDHPRFYIQVLFWLDGTTAIHQHEFSGVFHVMAGSSIHAHFEFKNPHPVTPHFRTGDLRMKKIELLETGRTVPIISGRDCIHSLFHLDTPSVTVVVRTQHDPGTGPQFNYLPPHIGYDPAFSDTLTARRKQLLDVLQQTGDASYPKLVLKMITDLDFERGFHILQHCMGHLHDLGAWDATLGAFRKKHGALAAGVPATLREEVRRDVIKALRSSIVEPEHRFFLALMMNVTTRTDLFALVAKRFPKKPPVGTVLRWVEELAEVSQYDITILDAVFPGTPGVAIEKQAQLTIEALRHFMAGDKKIPATLRSLPAMELKHWHATFAASSLRVLVEKKRR